MKTKHKAQNNHADILDAAGLKRNARAIQALRNEIDNATAMLQAHLEIFNNHCRAANLTRLDTALENASLRVGEQRDVLYFGVLTRCAISEIKRNSSFNNITEYSLRATKCPEGSIYERALDVVDELTADPAAIITFVPLTKSGKPMTSRAFKRYFCISRGLAE